MPITYCYGPKGSAGNTYWFLIAKICSNGNPCIVFTIVNLCKMTESMNQKSCIMATQATVHLGSASYGYSCHNKLLRMRHTINWLVACFKQALAYSLTTVEQNVVRASSSEASKTEPKVESSSPTIWSRIGSSWWSHIEVEHILVVAWSIKPDVSIRAGTRNLQNMHADYHLSLLHS